MNRNLYHTLSSWPKSYITDTDLATVINKSDSARYGLVNRALKDGHIIPVRRGLYLIKFTGFAYGQMGPWRL